MSQLLIVDVQQTFAASEELDKSILNLSKKFKGNIIYCYDTISGEGSWPYDMWSIMAKNFEKGKFLPTIIEKQYGFFREMMETYGSDEFIVSLARLMIQHKIHDARNICDLDEYEEFSDLYENFGIDPDFNSESFWLPLDLMESLKEKIESGVKIVGGGRTECLKEICLLLDVLDIKYEVLVEFTYT